jgi:hypothetical protein
MTVANTSRTARTRSHSRARFLSSVLALVLALSVIGAPSATAVGETGPDSPGSESGPIRLPERQADSDSDSGTPALDPRLAELADRVRAEDARGARALADSMFLDLEGGRVTTVVEVVPGQKGGVRSALKAFGAEETGEYEDFIRARVPVGVLNALARQQGVHKLRPPMRPQTATNPDELEQPESEIVTLEAPARGESVTSLSLQPATDAAFSDGFEAWPGPWAIWSPSGPTWDSTNRRSSEGVFSAYCAGSSASAPPYANNMESWIWTANPLDLSAESRPLLSFDVWYDTQPVSDVLFVGVSTDDITYYGRTYSGLSDDWESDAIDLTNISTESGTLSFAEEPEVYIAAVFVSDGSVVGEGAYIDNVRLSSASDAFVSQGVTETNASAMHAEGIDGTGTKVGIIDVGFHGYEHLLGTELPASVQTWGESSLGPEGSGTTEIHGTAVAEIAHDMAPGAQLYLAQIDDEIDFGNAAAWMVANGVDAVNVSLGWFEGPRNGTGILNEIANDTVAGGTFWAQAAGNSRQTHWRGNWVSSLTGRHPGVATRRATPALRRNRRSDGRGVAHVG